jgi:hypothetical protein
MTQKYNYDNTGIVSEKDYSSKSLTSHHDFDLFNEELHIKERVFTIKRLGAIDKNERWKISCDNKIILVVEGKKLSNKERIFLRTPEGFSFLISQAKNEVKSFSKLKVELKNKLK